MNQSSVFMPAPDDGSYIAEQYRLRVAERNRYAAALDRIIKVLGFFTHAEWRERVEDCLNVATEARGKDDST